MNLPIEILNQLGSRFLELAWPMLWQSSLLITALFAFDFLLRRRVRASVRYTLWLVVLVKLILSPTLALPTSPAWWLHKNPSAIQIRPEIYNYTVSYDQSPLPMLPLNTLPIYVPPAPVLAWSAWLLMASVVVSVSLLVWLLVRWCQITRLVRHAEISERLTALVLEVQPIVVSSRINIGAERQLRPTTKLHPPVKLTVNTMSPAVCGLFRPAILVPRTLAENFSDEQLRAVLLHELIHLRRGDVWLNFLQSLLQIVYWWHPLVWLANARIRRVREESVDDAVMLALAGDAETYAPTLLEVAKLALNRPLASLGLVGILESRSALRQRIERLVDFRPPRRAGMTLFSLLGVLVFTAVAVPMGGAPALVENQTAPVSAPVAGVADANGLNANPPQVLFQAVLYQMTAVDFQQAVSGLRLAPVDQKDNSWWAASPEQFNRLTENLKSVGLKAIRGAGFETDGSGPAMFCVGTGTNGLAQFCAGKGTDGVELDCLPRLTNGLIDLTIQNRGIGTFANALAPNSFSGNITLENHGGLVFCINNTAGSNVVVIVGVKTFPEPGVVNYYGILTNLNFQNALVVLQQRTGVETMAEPEVVTTHSYAVNSIDPSTLAAMPDKLTKGTGSQNDPSASSVVPNRIIRAFRTNYPEDDAGLKNLFLDAGVKMPPTTIVYADNNNGILLASGTKEQLAIVYRVVMKLDDISPVESEANVRQFLAENSETAEANFAATNIFIRIFKLDAHHFPIQVKKNTGMPVDNDKNISQAIRTLFANVGVDLISPKGQSVFYNGRNGMLLVRATETNLDMIEPFVEALNQIAPQVHIKARFIEVPKTIWNNYAKSLGINYLANQSAAATGIMTDQNFRNALSTLQLWNGVETLAEPEVLTTSGRQTQMRATQTIMVITNFTFQETVTNLATDFVSAKMVTNWLVMPQTTQVETGPVFDVIPCVLADGYTVNLTAIASLTDFLGYNNLTNAKAAFTSAGEKVDVPTISPSFQVRQAVATANLWDGQTLVMEVSIPKQIQEIRAGHADVPLVGRLFQSQSKTEPKKILLVFATVNIVDPAGNRVHVDADLPFAQTFAQTGIPVQPER